MVDRPGHYGVEDLAPGNALEERIYRLRCVEGWSMVISWIRVPLAAVLDRVGVQPDANLSSSEPCCAPKRCRASAIQS